MLEVPRGWSRVAWRRKGFDGDGGGKASLTLEGLATMTGGQTQHRPFVIHSNLSYIHQPQNKKSCRHLSDDMETRLLLSTVERFGTS
jgi:hypothetical protein